MSRHPLFQAALDADEQFTATIAELFPGRTRWSLMRAERLHPRIREAYTTKVEADRAWIDHLQTERAIEGFGSVENREAWLRGVNGCSDTGISGFSK